MSKATVEKWWPIYLVGVFIGIGFGWLLATATSNQQTNGASAIILMDAFHSGWVPQSISLTEKVDIKLAEGLHASEISVPLGTALILIFRNELGNYDLQENFESQYQPYFANKYGEDWDIIHADLHKPSMSGQNSPGSGSVEAQRFTRDEVNLQDFKLEGYNLNITLENTLRGNIKVVEFVADQLGEFKYQCHNVCFSDQEIMVGKLVVMPVN